MIFLAFIASFIIPLCFGQLEFRSNSKGLASLTNDGVELLKDGTFSLGLAMRRENGSFYSYLTSSIRSPLFNNQTNSITYVWANANATVTYSRVLTNRLQVSFFFFSQKCFFFLKFFEISVLIQNTSPVERIENFYGTIFNIILPGTMREYDGSTPRMAFNIGSKL